MPEWTRRSAPGPAQAAALVAAEKGTVEGAIREQIRIAYEASWIQAYASVEVALEASVIDGSLDKRRTALGNLKGRAVGDWKAWFDQQAPGTWPSSISIS